MSFGISPPRVCSWAVKGSAERALGLSFHTTEQGSWVYFAAQPRATFVQGSACHKWFSTGWVQALLWSEGQKLGQGRRSREDRMTSRGPFQPCEKPWLFHDPVKKEKPSRAVSSPQVWRSACFAPGDIQTLSPSVQGSLKI